MSDPPKIALTTASRVDSAFEQRGGIVRGDASDGDDGHVDARPHCGDESRRGAHRAGLGDGGKEAPERHVVGPALRRGERAVRLVVARDADDRVLAEPGASRGKRPVIPAEMDPVRSCREREVHVVVDDERYAARPADREQRLGVAPPSRGVPGLVAVLDRPDSVFHGGGNRVHEPRSATVLRRDRIDPPLRPGPRLVRVRHGRTSFPSGPIVERGTGSPRPRAVAWMYPSGEACAKICPRRASDRVDARDLVPALVGAR